MNCVFCCVFNKIEYVDMFLLLAESIKMTNPDIPIVVYTSTPFMYRIKSIYANIEFRINDTYHTVDKACKARLDLFHLMLPYNKILYLDTDCIVSGNLNQVFDLCTEDVVYTLEEGSLDIYNVNDWWGRTLFQSIDQYEDKTAFSSGVMLLNNSERMMDYFMKVQKDIADRPHTFNDQPHFVYIAFILQCYNNKALKKVVNNTMNLDFIVHHFPGTPGFADHKLLKMRASIDYIKGKYDNFV